ncbi:MAG: alpha/beta fold hydrolase [Pseudomonadota bacterium]
MPVLSTEDVDLYYEVLGEGPPLLLIAGLSSDGASWGPVAPSLAKSFTLIMPDNRGAGRTRDKGAISIDAMARDCAALLDHLSITQAHVLGHSMGGAIAMALASTAPDRVHRLALTATSAKTPARTISVIDSLLALREAGVKDEIWLRAFFHWLFAPAFFENGAAVDAAIALAIAYPHAQSTADMRRQVDAIRAFDASQSPARLKAPTLVLMGEDDLMLPPEVVTAGFHAAPNKQVETLAGAAHSLHWDQPTAFTAAVSAFFRSA